MVYGCGQWVWSSGCVTSVILYWPSACWKYTTSVRSMRWFPTRTRPLLMVQWTEGCRGLIQESPPLPSTSEGVRGRRGGRYGYISILTCFLDPFTVFICFGCPPFIIYILPIKWVQYYWLLPVKRVSLTCYTSDTPLHSIGDIWGRSLYLPRPLYRSHTSCSWLLSLWMGVASEGSLVKQKKISFTNIY